MPEEISAIFDFLLLNKITWYTVSPDFIQNFTTLANIQTLSSVYV